MLHTLIGYDEDGAIDRIINLGVVDAERFIGTGRTPPWLTDLCCPRFHDVTCILDLPLKATDSLLLL
jgi:hypothetical protein